MTHKNSEPLSYKDAGVDINHANEFVTSIRSIVQRTHRPGVIGNIGGFGALFEVPIDRYRQPILVSGTDGVGTKLKLAIEMNQHDTIGIDLVAMCANDILTLGAEPLFFLDYYATGKLSLKQSQSIMAGIGKGCESAGAALIGGETAEMPGMYHGGDYDLAGFCVGVVEKKEIIDGSAIKPNDVILALASSGPHANGYSLIRKILERGQHTLTEAFNQSTLGEVLLQPTRIYVHPILSLKTQLPIHGLVHITGGGLVENIPRILPQHLQAVLNPSSWTWPPIFQWLQEKGNVALMEMYRTFNLGVGMIIIVEAADAAKAIHHLAALGETVWQIGTIQRQEEAQPKVILDS